MEAYRNLHPTGHVAPFVDNTSVPTRGGNMPTTPPSEGRKKLYAEALSGKKGNLFKLTVKHRKNEPVEAVKKILKSSIDPTDMKIGIRTFKGLKDGKVLIEADTKDDIEKLNSRIREKCGDRLETNVQKRRKPRIIIYNIPDEVTLENAEDIISAQNPELALEKGDITTKFTFKTKKNARNLVTELAPQTCKLMLQNKIKIGWTIFNTDYYISVNSCFRCSRFNHDFSECKSEETCLLCAGKHKIKECTVQKEEYKCINCMTYNKYNQIGASM
jgi:hypothetical protein